MKNRVIKFTRIHRSLDKMENKIVRGIGKEYNKTRNNIEYKLMQLDKKGHLTAIEIEKYNRLKKLRKDINIELGKVTSTTSRKMKAGFKYISEASYKGTGKTIENVAKKKISSFEISDPMLDKIMKNPNDALGWLERNRINHREISNQAIQEIYQNVRQGKGLRDISQDLTERFNIAYSRAERIVRTEAIRVRNQAQLEAMRESNKVVPLKKQWNAELDERVRESHEDLNGVIKELEEEFEGLNGSGLAPGQMDDASENINCRCALNTILDEE